MELQLSQVCIKKSKGRYVCRYIPFNTANKRMHWTEKEAWRKAWAEEIALAVRLVREQLGKLPLAMPHLEILYQTIRLMDKDGLYTSAKPLLDGLIRAGVIVDDSPEDVNYEIKQTKVSKVKEQGVIISILLL